MNEKFEFDFDFGGANSAEMLDQTKKELLDHKNLLGGGDKQAADEEISKTEEFFAALKSGKIQFPQAQPTVFPIDIHYFKQNKLQAPKDYAVLSEQFKFYWIEVPVFLVQGEKPFYKVQMFMEFGEGEQIPKVHSAFPESKFAHIATVKGKLDFGLGEDFAFKEAASIENVALPPSIPIVKASVGGKLAVDAKLASNLGIVAGPFSYTIKRAQVECRFAGELVLWTIMDKDSLQEDNPIFIVILKMAKEVSHVRLKARAQAHRAAPLPQFIVRLLAKISPKCAEWLKKGSPITLSPYMSTINTP